jgi:hypothetical protein
MTYYPKRTEYIKSKRPPNVLMRPIEGKDGTVFLSDSSGLRISNCFNASGEVEITEITL